MTVEREILAVAKEGKSVNNEIKHGFKEMAFG